MQVKRSVWCLVCLVVLAACSAHNPFIVKNTTDVAPNTAAVYEPHGNPVWVTSEALPDTARYEVLGELEVGRVWYGGQDKALVQLAEGARQLGADAVVEVKTWHQPAGWSWSAPHGSGKAVKILDPASVDLSALPGDWR